jgi:hypothetical protein
MYIRNLRLFSNKVIPQDSLFVVCESYKELEDSVEETISTMKHSDSHSLVFMSNIEDFKYQWEANQAVYKFLKAVKPEHVMCSGQRGVGLAVASVAPLLDILTDVVYNGGYYVASHDGQFIEVGYDNCYATILSQYFIFKASLGGNTNANIA